MLGSNWHRKFINKSQVFGGGGQGFQSSILVLSRYNLTNASVRSNVQRSKVTNMWILLEQVCLKLLWNQESHLINGNKKAY